MSAMVRALEGVDEAICLKELRDYGMRDETGTRFMQPVNLGQIVRNNTNLQYTQLAYTHHALFGPQPNLYHDATYDTTALQAIYGRLLESTAGWFPEIYGQEIE
jgi:hypothetical protein